MTLHEHRGRFDRHMAPFIEWCAARGIEPNTLTAAALFTTILSAVVFFLSSTQRWGLLLVGAALLSIGSVLDSADGLLARATDQTSALGDYLDHVADRFADVAILLGLTFSPWVHLEAGVFAIAGTLLTSYMGTQAQAVGAGRDYGGLLGRADRLFFLVAAPIGQAILIVAGFEVPYGLNLVDLSVVWIAVAGIFTALQRFWATYGALSDDRTKLK